MLLNNNSSNQNDFITNWVSLINTSTGNRDDIDEYAKLALNRSLQNCLTFPWIKDKVTQNELTIHLWFFDVKKGEIFTCDNLRQEYQLLEFRKFLIDQEQGINS